MKLWLKYALAGAAGILAGFVVQPDTALYLSVLGTAEFGLRLGRFVLFPLFFFTLAVSVCQLRRDSLLTRTFVKLMLFSLAAGILQILISTGLALLLPSDRIPIISGNSGLALALSLQKYTRNRQSAGDPAESSACQRF